MPITAWFTLGVILLVLGLMIHSNRAPDMILWGGVGLLMLAPFPSKETDGWQIGLIDAQDAFAGLANEGVVTIAVLFVVAACLRETGVMYWLGTHLLGRPKSILQAQNRILWPIATMSAFFNNTPLVAIMLPVVDDWCKRQRISPSKILIPLSYASILGGACTLIGTSTNLIVNGWLINELNHPGLSLFEVGKVGLPVAIAGLIFVLFLNRWLLPERTSVIDVDDDVKQYTVELTIKSDCPLIGQTIEQAGLRNLPGLYLIEIERGTQVMPAVSANIQLMESDHLVFAGILESVVDLLKIRGLEPSHERLSDQDASNRLLVELVVSNSCPLIGETVRAGRFRTRYNAAIIAVARNGERVTGKIGNIVLQAGDILLVEARLTFLEQQRNSRDFYLVSQVEDARPVRHDRAALAAGIMIVMLLLAGTGLLSMLQAALLAGGLMLITGCISASIARRSIDWETLLVIAAAIGIGKGIQTSGLAFHLGSGIQYLVGSDPMALLTCIFISTMILSNLVTAKAGAVLMLPIAHASAENIGADFTPFAIAIMLSAATALATPIGYPTNLMVYGPGGYRFGDYLRIGGPLSILIAVIAIPLIPLIWPF